MNVVDSSGWLEFLASGKNATFFEPAITDTSVLVVPTISLFEVFKRLHSQHGEDTAIDAIVSMQEGRVVPLGTDLALAAAVTSIEEGLPLADSVMLATARAHGATLWTQDEHFEGKEGVRHVRKGT